MKTLYLFTMDLFIMICEMLIAGSLVYTIMTENFPSSVALHAVWLVSFIAWIFILFMSLVDMYNHLGD